MKEKIFLMIAMFLVVSCMNCKESKTLQQELDYYIENEDFSGINHLTGKIFNYDNSRIDNTSLVAYPIFSEINYNDADNYRNASIRIYTNNMKKNFSIIYTAFSIKPQKKTKDYKGVDVQINKIVLLNCDPGYRFRSYAACKYNEKGEIVLAGSVMCLRKAKILEDGSTEDITVWYEKKIPEYVIEIRFSISNPDVFLKF